MAIGAQKKKEKKVGRQLLPTPISYAPVIFLKFFPLYHNKPILSNENRDYYTFGKYQPKYLGTCLVLSVLIVRLCILHFLPETFSGYRVPSGFLPFKRSDLQGTVQILGIGQ